MKLLLAAAVASTFVVSAVHAETVWRWTDAGGTLHYSNQRALAPASAVEMANQRTPGHRSIDRRDSEPEPGLAPSEARPVEKRLHKIYDEERMRFGCYSAGVLYFGGWAHADDLSSSIGCYRYLLGPEAWLNTARAELAVRENGISPQELYRMYREGGRD